MANGDQITVNNQTTQATVIINAYAPRAAVINGELNLNEINTSEPGTYTVQVTLSNAADNSMTHSQTVTVVIP